MSIDQSTVTGDAQEEERAWRRHERRMYVVMTLLIVLVVGIIGVVLGGTMNGAGDDAEAPSTHAVELDSR
jgi:hypothetical protein